MSNINSIGSALMELDVRSLAMKDALLLKNISFSVNPHELFIILGLSGSGKSLLLECMAGDLAFDGSISFREDVSKAERTFSYDIFSTFTQLKVGEVVSFLSEMYCDKIDEKLLKQLKLDELRTRPFQVLSKGEKKRLGIYAALFSDPLMAILDEPTDGMDPPTRSVFWEIVKQRQSAIVMTTHLWEEAQQHHDKIALIAKGSLIAEPDTSQKLCSLVPYTEKLIIPKIGIQDAPVFLMEQKEESYLYLKPGQKEDVMGQLDASGVLKLGYSSMPINLNDAYILLQEKRCV